MTEAKVQKKIKDFLESNGWMVQKQETSKNGFPDLMAIGFGTVIFIEVKATGLKPKPLQTEMMRQIRRRMSPVNWFDDFDKFKVWYYDTLELNHNLSFQEAVRDAEKHSRK
jgi:hypothetical protein